MNSSEDNLNRLLRSAAQAPVPAASDELPFGFETRVLAGWRETRDGFRPTISQVIFQRALVCALVVMLGAVATGIYEMAAPEPTESLLAASTIEWALD